MRLSYLLCLECPRPGLDKHSALMSFTPLFIPYLLTSMTHSLSFFFPLSPLSSLPLYSHSDVFLSTAPLFLLFLLTVSLCSTILSFALSGTFSLLSVFLRLSPRYSPSLFQFQGNLRYLSADVRPCTAPLCARLCCDADKKHCLATLPQACIFQINRCSFTHTHKPPFKFTEVL